jgi:hypothetical protein
MFNIYNFIMKKILIIISASIIFISCGGADNNTVDIDGVRPTEHRVFITKAGTIKGDFSSSSTTGLAGADELCNTYADAAGLTKDYKAILTDGTNTAKDRLVFTGAIYTVTGSEKRKVADSSVELFNADTVPLLSKIDWDEDGMSVSSGNVWTGSNTDGTNDGAHCTNWTDATTGTGNAGDVNETGQKWIDNNPLACTSTAHLYCISQ